MANPYPVALRERAAHMYEDGLESYAEVADECGVGPATLKRWVHMFRATGAVARRARGGAGLRRWIRRRSTPSSTSGPT